MNRFKKDLASNITLLCVLVFSAVHLLLLTLNLFNVTNFALPYGFSYITAYILMIFSFALYIGCFFVENIKRLTIPTWFKIMFYIAFFLFTNVYYILGLYQNIIFMLAFVAYIAFLINIIALAVHFHVNKDEHNKLKLSTMGLIFNTATYSVALSALVLFIISLVKIIIGTNTLLTGFIFEFLTMLVVCAVIEIMFAVSHKKSKRIINKFLIKFNPKQISRSVKK